MDIELEQPPTINLPQLVGEKEIELASLRAELSTVKRGYGHALAFWAVWDGIIVPMRELLLVHSATRRARLALVKSEEAVN